MKKYSVPLFIDIIFSFFVCFILVFVILSYYIPRPYCFVISVSAAIFFTVFAAKFLKSKQDKLNEKSKNQELFASFLFKLNSSAAKENADLFFNAFKNLGETPQKLRGGIFIKDRGELTFVKFSLSEVQKKDVFHAVNLADKQTKVVIYSESFSQEVVCFASRFNGKVSLKDGKAAFDLLKKANALPELKDAPLPEKKKPTSDFSRLINKKRAKNYLFFGLTFLFFSYFAPFKLYYIIFGATFLVLSLVVKLFGKEEKQS